MNLDSAVFYSNDLPKTVAFYKDVLEFHLDYMQEGRFASFIFPNQTRLGIKQSQKKREIPGHQTIFIRTDNITELYSRLQNKATLYKPLSKEDWAENFAILDPDSNKVEFVKYYE